MNLNYILTLIILLIFKVSFAQDYQNEAIQLIKPRGIYLNGGLRASFGGKSRTYIKVDLPQNTVKWYYSFSTERGESGTQNLNLAIQLSSMMVAGPIGSTSINMSGVEVPAGSASIDVYLCDRANIDAFIEKVDNDGGTFYYTMEGTTKNTRQAIVEVDDVTSGTIYLGLKNPSMNDGVNISIEVVAILAKELEKSEDQQRAELYAGLGWKQFEQGEFEKCIEFCDKATAEYELGWVLANKGLAQLMLERESEGMETYVSAITVITQQPYSEYILGELINDIEKALLIKPNLSHANDVKELMQLKLKLR